MTNQLFIQSNLRGSSAYQLVQTTKPSPFCQTELAMSFMEMVGYIEIWFRSSRQVAQSRSLFGLTAAVGFIHSPCRQGQSSAVLPQHFAPFLVV